MHVQKRMRGSDLGGSVSEVDSEGGGQALVGPAGKVDQLHAEAAAEPHHVSRPQVTMHDVPLVQATQSLAHLPAHHTIFKYRPSSCMHLQAHLLRSLARCV